MQGGRGLTTRTLHAPPHLWQTARPPLARNRLQQGWYLGCRVEEARRKVALSERGGNDSLQERGGSLSPPMTLCLCLSHKHTHSEGGGAKTVSLREIGGSLSLALTLSLSRTHLSKESSDTGFPGNGDSPATHTHKTK